MDENIPVTYSVATSRSPWLTTTYYLYVFFNAMTLPYKDSVDDNVVDDKKRYLALKKARAIEMIPRNSHQ